jgi:hypothetical protein
MNADASAPPAMSTGRESLTEQLLAALRDPGLLIGEVVQMVVAYADSPTWVDAHAQRVTELGLIARPSNGDMTWGSVLAVDPLPADGVVSFDVHVVGDDGWPFAIGVVSSECVHLVRSKNFSVGNLQSFGVDHLGFVLHNQMRFHGSTNPFGTLTSGDVIRTEIDHGRRAVSFVHNGVSEPAFVAGSSIVRSTADAWTDGRVIIGWPADGKFYPCVSAMSPAVQFRINDNRAPFSSRS